MLTGRMKAPSLSWRRAFMKNSIVRKIPEHRPDGLFLSNNQRCWLMPLRPASRRRRSLLCGARTIQLADLLQAGTHDIAADIEQPPGLQLVAMAVAVGRAKDRLFDVFIQVRDIAF